MNAAGHFGPRRNGVGDQSPGFYWAWRGLRRPQIRANISGGGLRILDARSVPCRRSVMLPGSTSTTHMP